MINQKSTIPFRYLLLLMLVLPLLIQCNTAPEVEPAETGGDEPTRTEISAEAEPAASAPSSASTPPGFDGKTWDDVLTEAKGQTVNWYMWGGADNINNWVNTQVGETLKNEYDVTLNMVPLVDTVEAVNKVLSEKEAGIEDDGSIDLVWINGENFRTLRQADMLFGPWSQFLPNSAYVDWDDPSVNTDLGFPVDYYESPYGTAQMVMIYDSAKLAEPPTSIDGLIEWIKANPGKFTYPAPPDFTGTAFMMHICYHATSGHEQFLGEFDQALFDEKFAACWETLNEIEPYLWREGETYPESHVRQQDLFANSKVYFDMAYNPTEASSHVESGKFPESTRTFIFDSGTIANTHYVAIPFNSPNKAGAMVAANVILSPEAQFSKADTANWGDFPAIVLSRLPAEWQEKFNNLPRGVATLPIEVLAANRLPELQATWRVAAEKAWEEEVLKK
ncbi:ABC transporter substrate-binding protein [Anaerolineales bacterium HSG6]|nr:ABC transporter substrate-binding protein [Anaerolineales bacterium HSG6]